MHHRVGVVGQAGSGKSTFALSYPGVEQHVFGSSEEATALNFFGRTDILKPVKLDWFDTLTDLEKAKLTDEKIGEQEIALLQKTARARNIIRYRRYLYQLKSDLKGGKRPEVQSVVLDNLTPFSLEFEDYIEVVYGKEFVTKEGNFDTISYYKRFASEFTDFVRLFMGLECHTIVTAHVSMAASEEVSANTLFLKAASMGGVKKEWQPMITGKARFIFASIPDWVFFMKAEENPGQPTRYIAKLEADDSNIGVAKPRINPFTNPRRIIFPRNEAFKYFDSALSHYLATGKQLENK